ncbi:YciI family protein [Pelagibius sp.]|uniref:YciI family protein n=1 Tax=Pelagibius sp. TaxID=1931238 RepID=UPI002612887A|nr:YciI family protein [Pelagibius sp.]
MLYVVLFEDNEERGTELRREHLPAHLEFLERSKDRITAAGPLLSAASAAEGGLWLVEARDREAVERLVKDDPFWPTGLRRSYRIAVWKQVFAAGHRLV